MKYLGIFVLLSLSIAFVSAIKNLPQAKPALRTSQDITVSSIEASLPEIVPTPEVSHSATATTTTTTTTIVPESTSTLVTPVHTHEVVTPVHTHEIVTPIHTHEIVTPVTTHQVVSPVTTTTVVTPVVHTQHLPVVQDVSTLVELPIDYHHSISYYYPYFYKTHLITFADEVDTTILVTTCAPGSHCSYCDPHNFEHCHRCEVGFYLNGHGCDLFCPDGYVSDILRLRCVPVTTTITEVVYTKAYSFGSCKNMCGRAVSDCSCSPSCKQAGNCCSDYDTVNCDALQTKSAKVSKEACASNTNCELCDDSVKIGNIPSCNQCLPGFFLHEGKCHQTCPEGTVGETSNYTCLIRRETCLVEGCEECVKGNPSVCKTCERGHFLHNNMCQDICPDGLRADRITWTCLEPPVFAWYWVYPSRTSCQTHCGHVIQEDWDCSCSVDCFRYGNCCQDIEDHCQSLLFWRKAAPMRKATTFLKK